MTTATESQMTRKELDAMIGQLVEMEAKLEGHRDAQAYESMPYWWAQDGISKVRELIEQLGG